jgi:hypothetical protein
MKHPFDPNRKPLWLPEAMRFAPALPRASSSISPRSLFLINPFYPKDPHASFGKHVLTPTLAFQHRRCHTPKLDRPILG